MGDKQRFISILVNRIQTCCSSYMTYEFRIRILTLDMITKSVKTQLEPENIEQCVKAHDSDSHDIKIANLLMFLSIYIYKPAILLLTILISRYPAFIRQKMDDHCLFLPGFLYTIS